MSEPLFGYRNLIKAKKEGKVKAFFSLLIPTESIGTIEIAGFKVVSGSKGLFVSLPNRAVKTTGSRQVVDMGSGETQGAAIEETKYYNNIRFENQEMYNEFRKEINDNILPMIETQLSKV